MIFRGLTGERTDIYSQMDPSVLDDIIRRLLDARNHRVGKQVEVSEAETRQLCTVSRDIFLRQPCFLQLEAPIKIAGINSFHQFLAPLIFYAKFMFTCGDIHGQYHDLLRLFDFCGFPPDSNYLFLGNYLDFGRQSLETMWLLLAYKIKNPENLFMLRGNHEFASLSRIYGFYDECVRRFNARLHPCGFRSDKILCVHGGLSPELHNLDEIRNIIRPIDVPNSGLLCDLLCSDPSNEVQGWGMNDRDSNYLFLGNYLDFGRQSLETMWLLLAYKIKNPENLFMLRGNHEFASLSRIYGFYDECVRRFNARLHPCGFRSRRQDLVCARWPLPRAP
ncbi:LOW QUALITY PROTEIN: hypothetical protein V2J09_011077 [Rumex salicifolius]